MCVRRATEIDTVRRAQEQCGKADGPRAAYTIPEFCVAHRISTTKSAEGLGPREGRGLTKVIITLESAAEWRKRIVAEQETAA